MLFKCTVFKRILSHYRNVIFVLVIVPLWYKAENSSDIIIIYLLPSLPWTCPWNIDHFSGERGTSHMQQVISKFYILVTLMKSINKINKNFWGESLQKTLFLISYGKIVKITKKYIFLHISVKKKYIATIFFHF